MRIFGVCILLGLVIIAGCSGAGVTNPGIEEEIETDIEIVELYVSWSKIYESIEELLEDSDLVVIGVVGDFIGVRPDPDLTDYVDTMLNLKVEQVLFSKSGDDKPDSTIVLLQHGGFYKNKNFILKDSPHYTPGERVLLFLRKTSDNLGYWPVTAQGRFIIENNTIYTLKHHHSDAHVIVNFNSEPLQQFIDKNFGN